MNYIFKLSDIEKKLADIRWQDPDADLVELIILEGEEFDGQLLPTTLNFEVPDGWGGVTDFNDIEAVACSVDFNYQFKIKGN